MQDVYKANVIVVGQGSAGKTHLCRNLLGEDFTNDDLVTNGIAVSGCVLNKHTTDATFNRQADYPPDDLVWKLSREIGNEWEEVAAFLGVNRAQIDKLKHDYSNDMFRQIGNMLFRWRDGMGTTTDEERRNKLKEALTKARRNDLAGSLSPSPLSEDVVKGKITGNVDDPNDPKRKMADLGQEYLESRMFPDFYSQIQAETTRPKPLIEQASRKRNDEEDYDKLSEEEAHGAYFTEDASCSSPVPTKSDRFETVQEHTATGLEEIIQNLQDDVPRDNGKLLEGRSRGEYTTENAWSSLPAQTKSDGFETGQGDTATCLEEAEQDECREINPDDVSLPGCGSDLHLAAIRDDCQAISKLIDEGADVNLQDNDGRSCLHIAAERGFADIVSYVIDKGADVNLQDNECRSSIYLALDNRHGDIATMLYEAGAKLPDEGNLVPRDVKTKMQLIIQKRADGLAKEHDSLRAIFISCTVNGDGTRPKEVPYFVFVCNDKEKKATFPRELGVTKIGTYGVLVREGSTTLFADNEGQPGALDLYELPVGCYVTLGGENDFGSLGMFMNIDENRFDFQRRQSIPHAFLTCYHVIGTYADHLQFEEPGRSAINKRVFAKTHSVQWNCGTVCDTSLGNVKLDNDLLEYGVDAAAIVLNRQAKPNMTVKTPNNVEVTFHNAGYLDVHDLTWGDTVHKFGSKTGYTSGQFYDDSGSVVLEDHAGSVRLYNMIRVTSNPGTNFSEGGDSGAAVYVMKNGTPRVIGLLVGSCKMNDGSNECFTVVSRIVPTLKSLSTALNLFGSGPMETGE